MKTAGYVGIIIILFASNSYNFLSHQHPPLGQYICHKDPTLSLDHPLRFVLSVRIHS